MKSSQGLAFFENILNYKLPMLLVLPLPGMLGVILWLVFPSTSQSQPLHSITYPASAPCAVARPLGSHWKDFLGLLSALLIHPQGMFASGCAYMPLGRKQTSSLKITSQFCSLKNQFHHLFHWINWLMQFCLCRTELKGNDLSSFQIKSFQRKIISNWQLAMETVPHGNVLFSPEMPVYYCRVAYTHGQNDPRVWISKSNGPGVLFLCPDLQGWMESCVLHIP